MAKYKVGYDLKKLEFKESNSYIFPSKLAKMMNKVDLRVQLEASMMSLTLLMIGMVLYCIYTIIYTSQSWFIKGFLAFNMLCGIVLMSTYLITNFQQYKNYMDTMGIDSEHEKEVIKKKGNIFTRIKLAMAEGKEKKAQNKAIEASKVNKIDELIKDSGVNKEIRSEEVSDNEEETSKIQEEMFGEEVIERRTEEE